MTGFSSDGYIICQDCFKEYKYRTISSARNGCGWMAVYNLRHFLEGFDDFNSVRKEMDDMHSLKMPGPTIMRVMRKYLAKHSLGIREYTGRKQAILAAKNSRCGIFRYYEEGIPHFVTYIRTEKGIYRFFNVNDGLEDFTATIDEFAEKHFLCDRVIALVKL